MARGIDGGKNLDWNRDYGRGVDFQCQTCSIIELLEHNYPVGTVVQLDYTTSLVQAVICGRLTGSLSGGLTRGE